MPNGETMADRKKVEDLDGRELDIAIAQEVEGAVVGWPYQGDPPSVILAEGDTTVKGRDLPRFHDDLEAAMRIAELEGISLVPVRVYPNYEALNRPWEHPDVRPETWWAATRYADSTAHGREDFCLDGDPGPYVAIDERFVTIEPSAPKAICRAALKAVRERKGT